jgi:hypothetical protein
MKNALYKGRFFFTLFSVCPKTHSTQNLQNYRINIILYNSVNSDRN